MTEKYTIPPDASGQYRALLLIANELAELNATASEMSAFLDCIDDRLASIAGLLSTTDGHGNTIGVADVVDRGR